MKKQPRKKFVEALMRHVREKYGIGNRKLTKADFYRICEGEKINILNLDCHSTRELLRIGRTVKGFYLCAEKNGKTGYGIWLRCYFFKRFDPFTAFHELGHHFCAHLHGFRSTNDFIKHDPQKEGEADYFAELALNMEVSR